MEVNYNNFSFGNSARGKTNLNNVPGPGLYNSKSGFNNKGAKFNVEERKININNVSIYYCSLSTHNKIEGSYGIVKW